MCDKKSKIIEMKVISDIVRRTHYCHTQILSSQHTIIGYCYTSIHKMYLYIHISAVAAHNGPPKLIPILYSNDISLFHCLLACLPECVCVCLEIFVVCDRLQFFRFDKATLSSWISKLEFDFETH